MGSRDRDSRTFQDKLKELFKGRGAAPARAELAVSPELERELAPAAPLHRRLRALRDLSDRALHARIQDGGVEKVWRLTRDLLEDEAGGGGGGGAGGAEGRQAALGWWRCVAEGQADRLQLMRTVLFRYLRASHAAHAADDAPLRLRLLHALTDHGKNIRCFENEIGGFLVAWLAELQAPAPLAELLQLLTNVVKFNASALDDEVVHGIINLACHVCVTRAEPAPVAAALALLEAVVCYSLVPRAALGTFVAALCRTVSLEHYTTASWKLMRLILNGDTGPAALQELCGALRRGGERAPCGDVPPAPAPAPAPCGDVPPAPAPCGDVPPAPAPAPDAGLLRGAVFYLNMALWGPQRVPTLKVSFLAVLPALLKAVQWRLPVVTYEVVLALQGLVARAPPEPALHEPAWDVLLDIVRAALEHDMSLEPPNEPIHQRVHALITSVEQLQAAGQFAGDADRLLGLVHSAAHLRPESSAMWVVSQRVAQLSPAGRDWINSALSLAETYLRQESRLNVRLHTLHALAGLAARAPGTRDELVERVALPVLQACALDPAPALRTAAAQHAAELARHAPPDAAADLIDLLEKILNRPFEMYVHEVPIPLEAGAEAAGLRAAAAGLRGVLRARLARAPPAHAQRALVVLLDHLDHHYRRPALFHHHPDIRLKIFEVLFGLRANAFNCVGLLEEGAELRARPAVYSPFLVAEPPSARQQPPPAAAPPPGAAAVPVARMSRTLCAALAREADWPVLQALLRALPALLAARALLVGRRAHELDVLAATLAAMVSERCVGLAEGARPTVSELHAAALPALAALAPYHALLEPPTVRRLVRCLLKYGMALRAPQPYINALTIFTLEARDTMVRLLPEVLLDLSKVSDTQAIAPPMLEFLSTLTRLPRVFASFVEDQYMSVFAILLPYTNPSRYNHYVVSLAHHVIAAWFLKCRLSYRRNFVRFIIHGLHNYIIMPFEEQLQSSAFQPAAAAAAAATAAANEDSSQRQRSSSLGSRAVSRAPLGGAGGGGGGGGAGRGAASAAFHVELTETCVDLLSRYAFTPCSVKPQRSDTAEFLFAGGQAATWLVGHKLVTITTSGCAQNAVKQGLCDRCAVLCRQHAESAGPPPAPATPQPPTPQPPTPQPPATQPPTPQPQVSLDVPAAAAGGSDSSDSQSRSGGGAPEVKRYSKHSLQHSRSTETSCSSLSISELQPPSAAVSRQNSGETRSSERGDRDPVADALTHFSQRFDKISKEVDTEEGWWWRAGQVAAAGGCPCWCAHWAEVHVRSPTGDVAWAMRMQNQMSWDHLLESPLQDVAALLCAPFAAAGAGAPAHAPQPQPPSPRTPQPQPEPRNDDSSTRARSSSASARPSAHHLHKSSSDTVVASERRPAHAHAQHPPPQRAGSGGYGGGTLGGGGGGTGTAPINIPGSPQRQSSSSTTDDDDMLLVMPTGKSRHPVRRSNSSPEMSSSWKLGEEREPPAPAHAPREPPDMILLPAEHPSGAREQPVSVVMKKCKKSEMRVSCEAIPEEMCGTSPLQPDHPPLMTYSSDPGTAAAEGAAAGDDARHQLQKTASDSTVPSGAGRPPASPRLQPAGAGAGAAPAGAAPAGEEELPPLARSRRSNTISVMSPTRHRTRESGGGSGAGGGARGGGAAGGGGGVTPSFVFLQLYHNMSTYPITLPVPGEAPAMLSPLAERPLKLSGAQHERTIKNLDLVPPVDTYKVGVLYVGAGQQDNEVAILRNEHGSVRYAEFLSGLGSLVSLAAGDAPPDLFLNLETGGKDGHYTYVWTDDVMQVLFHVATAMPSSERDPSCNEKRKYIGNDFVSIVYNDSGQDFNIHTIKGQFNFCVVVVEPQERALSRVHVQVKDDRLRAKFLSHLEPHTLSDGSAALLARQQALHAALASQIWQSLRAGCAAYASNSLERLRMIKRLRRRAEAERLAQHRAPPYHLPAHTHLASRIAIDDFNDYT